MSPSAIFVGLLVLLAPAFAAPTPNPAAEPDVKAQNFGAPGGAQPY